MFTMRVMIMMRRLRRRMGMMMSAWLPRHHHMMAVSALLSLSSRPCKFRPAPDPKDATLQVPTGTPIPKPRCYVQQGRARSALTQRSPR